jgi:hypothetical protein
MPPIFFGKSFRQAGLLRDPFDGDAVQRILSPFYCRRFFCFSENPFQASGITYMIPCWGCGSKDFITVFQTVLFLFL